MRDVLTSPKVLELKKKRRAYLIRLTILLSLLFIVLFSAIAFFSADRHLVLSKINVTGARIINPSEVEETAKKDLSGRYIHLFSRANSFIYPSDKIYNDLLKQFPRIETLSLSKDNLNTLHISIKERAGNFLYCGSSVPELKSDVGENCYFVNNDGYIFDKAPYFSGNVYFKYYIPKTKDESNPLWPMGTQMLSSDDFHHIVSFVDQVEALGFKPIYILSDQDGDYSLYLDGVNNPKIVFSFNKDLDLTFDNLSLAMHKEEFANEINSKYDSLLYIDLRFKNKVIYKFQ